VPLPRNRIERFLLCDWFSCNEHRVVVRPTVTHILNMIQEYRKILDAIYDAINMNGWVMCNGMMDCCVMYWKEGCWVKEQQVEEGYSYYRRLIRKEELQI